MGNSLRSLESIYRKIAPTVSSQDVKAVAQILNNPRSNEAGTSKMKMRAYLGFRLGLSTRELDSVLLSFFVAEHADEIATTETDGYE